MTITIDTYTGRWQSALRPIAPRIGTIVNVKEAYTADDREMDDFERCLGMAGRCLEWVHYIPSLRVDVFRVVRTPEYEWE